MAKISSKSIQLSFEGDCLHALQQFAHPSKSGSEGQVRVDLRRTHALTIGKWHYEVPSESSSANKDSARIVSDLENFFI